MENFLYLRNQYKRLFIAKDKIISVDLRKDTLILNTIVNSYRIRRVGNLTPNEYMAGSITTQVYLEAFYVTGETESSNFQLI